MCVAYGYFVFKGVKMDNNKKFNLLKLLTNVSLYLMLFIIAIIVVSLFGYISLGAGLVKLLLVLCVVCASTWLAMPWARRLQGDPKHKTVSIVFLSLVGVLAVLWIVGIFMSANLIDIISKAVKNEASEELLAKSTTAVARYLKWVVVFFIQFIFANSVATTIIKYGKEKLPYQVILYVCGLFLDVFFVKVLFIFNITEDYSLKVSNADFFKSKFVWLLFVLSVIILFASSAFNKRYEKRRRQEATISEVENARQSKKEEAGSESIEVKLEKLKNLLEQKLITQEEYDAKKQEILKEL